MPAAAAPDAGGGGRADFTGRRHPRRDRAARPDVGIVTLAPELDGGSISCAGCRAGHHVSLGHSGATYEEALAAIAAGARQATHLFNRMPPLDHRAPGLAGAVLQTDEVAAEIICDGVHVHPAMMRVALAAKRPSGIMAITDGTAGSGLPRGSRTTLGGRPITVARRRLSRRRHARGQRADDGRRVPAAGDVVGLSLVDAATVCATTPARELGLVGHGVLAPARLPT